MSLTHMDTPPSRRDKWLARLWGLVKKTLLLLPFAGPLLEPGSLRYLRALPVRRLVRLLLALFFTFSAIGFYLDLVQWRLASRTTVVLAGLLIGGVAVSSFLIIRRSARLLPLLFVLGVILGLTIDRLPRGALPAPGDEAHRAIVRDATAMLLAIMVGYRSFLGFIGHEGVEHLRLNTELALAHDIQRTLVPSVIHRGLRFQAYGRTVPSDKVGGDLVDLTAAGTNKWLAYVADVSGHGIPAGVLMGNIKTAIRLGADSQQPLPDLLNALNRVLPSVKDASMYTTFAGVK